MPAPVPGDINSTVKPRSVERRKPVGLGKSGTAADGVVVKLKAVKAVKAKAVGPGEVSGPALRVDVLVRNNTTEPLDLGSAVVTLTDDQGRPGASMAGSPASRLPAELQAQGQVSAAYVFDVARAHRNPVTIEVNLAGAAPIVVFRGRADEG